MDILNPRSLREDAQRALTRGRDPKKLVYTYAAIGLAISLLVTLADLWLEQEISGTGGLSNLGTRAIFSTAQQAVPVISAILVMCLELGYLSGMMRISRGQYADHTDLKVGLHKFFPLMRLNILQYLIFLAVGILAVQIAAVIFAMTPWSQPAMDAVLALSAADPAALTEADLLTVMDQMVPMYVISGIVFLIALIPFLFRMRMARFCLLDDPNGRALAAIRSSSKMMRRRFLPMLKVDLSLWIYYAALVVMNVLMYADWILAAFGVQVPLEPKTFSLLVYGGALILQFGIQISMRNRVEAIYVTAYDRLREKPKEGGSVVLGNIFDM